MDHIALVTGADRGLGFALSKELLERGWRVFAGQYMPEWPELAALASQFPGRLDIVSLDVSSNESVRAAAQAVSQRTDHIDLLISNAGIGGGRQELREGLDAGMYSSARMYSSAAIHRVYDVNALGAIRMVEALLPLTDRGMRRLAFVSSEAGSIAMAHRQGGFAYGMSKAALNMAVKLMFNHLRPEGYTFRLYYPGWIRSYMGGTKSTVGDMEPDEAAARAIPFFLEQRDDEDRLTLIGYQGEEWPF